MKGERKMFKKVDLQKDEHVLSHLTGLVEIFDGEQNIYYGDLFLTNRRIYFVSAKLINVEKSFWLKGEELKDIQHTALIVGEHSIAVRWAHSGNHLCFIKAFHTLKVNG